MLIQTQYNGSLFIESPRSKEYLLFIVDFCDWRIEKEQLKCVVWEPSQASNLKHVRVCV